MRTSFLLLALSVPAAAGDDWLLAAERAARAVTIPGEEAPAAVKSDWVPYESPSRMFRADVPPEGWRAYEEEDASGAVMRLLGADPAGAPPPAALSVRLIDRDTPGHRPPKQAVEAMRRPAPGREPGAVTTLRVPAGLARLFEINGVRRLTGEEGPAFAEELHQYVAVIPRGDSYYLVRLVSTRADYLDHREVFVRFLKSLKPIGTR